MAIGIQSRNGFQYQWADSDRFLGGMDLFSRGKAGGLEFTAGRLPCRDQHEREGVVLKRCAGEMSISTASILTSHEVRTTEDKAQAIRKLLISPTARMLRVPTESPAARSVQPFGRRGFFLCRYRLTFKLVRIALADIIPSAGALRLASSAVREQLGCLYYRFKGLVVAMQRAPPDPQNCA